MGASRVKDEAEIRERIAGLIDAVRAMDLERVMSIYAHDIVSFDIEPPLQKTAARAAHFAESLADASEAALRSHGRNIVEREFVQERLAEAAADLYALVACLSRANTRMREVTKAHMSKVMGGMNIPGMPGMPF